MKYATVVAVALLSGCTVDNPNYVGDGDAGFTPDGALHLDGGSRDLTAKDAPITGQCTDGERRCENGSSQICINAMYTVDRMCPQGSQCQQGYCQPPPAMGGQLGADCAMTTFAGDGPSENQCLAVLTDKLSCEPFFDPSAGGIVWRCDREIGSGVPATPCTMGSQCRSGFCGSNGTCFRACQGDQDCPVENGSQTFCRQVSIVVEGQQVTAGSCTP
jgi:hypothetical protein